jgi:16S rRNA processing protein RimM
MEKYIAIGRAVNTHGLKGELKIESWSDFDAERYRPGQTVWLYRSGAYTPFTVATYRPHQGFALVSFEGFQDISRIESWKGAEVCIQASQRPPLKEGYYMDQLIGLTVQDEEGRRIGRITAVESTSGAQNNLRVAREGGRTALIPNVPAFVKKIDLEKSLVVIHVEEGLL